MICSIRLSFTTAVIIAAVSLHFDWHRCDLHHLNAIFFYDLVIFWLCQEWVKSSQMSIIYDNFKFNYLNMSQSLGTSIYLLAWSLACAHILALIWYIRGKIQKWKSHITANVLISENGNNLFYNKAISDIIKHYSPFFNTFRCICDRLRARYCFARLDALGRRLKKKLKTKKWITQ